MPRTSVVKHIQVNDIGLASTFMAGDLFESRPRIQALAVQRQRSVFLGNEGNFQDFAVFSKPIPKPIVYEKITLRIHNPNPFIQVENVKIEAASAAAHIHIGSIRHIDAEARIKHIRQLEPKQ